MNGNPFRCTGQLRKCHPFNPVALLDVLALALPLLFIAATFGVANAGNYAQVQRLSEFCLENVKLDNNTRIQQSSSSSVAFHHFARKRT